MKQGVNHYQTSNGEIVGIVPVTLGLWPDAERYCGDFING